MVSFFISLLQFFSITVSSPLISLSSGAFRGLTVNGTDRWLGIPYAQPPVGALRFKTPLSISRPSEGVQDAFHFSHACPQPPTTAPISEDCLSLNVRHVILDHFKLRSPLLGNMQVWRPQQTSSTAKLPVFVWIHVRTF